ncbi:NfeD family protein [Cephaloticoccus primus]|uniref:NfeD family protein n=1 Tax=Cephaloticoccus primus TaxID=1548207 RepID=UPI0009EE9744|nr:NfeD family protein [Cephaloticoccus primus]
MLPKALSLIGYVVLLLLGAVAAKSQTQEARPAVVAAAQPVDAPAPGPLAAAAPAVASAEAAPSVDANSPLAAQLKVVVIPIREAIAKPTLYVVRRGLKEAIERAADMVVIDMDTPGGEAGAMLEIMEALDKFPGKKFTYVNSEAISAGAIIASVSDEIYFAPRGVMGAADVVTGSGADIPAAMKRKIDSYISAKIESYTTHAPRRAEVIKAMRLPEFELKLDGQVIKEKGELLTLTAEKAIALYGEPPTPLLAAGVADDVESLLDSRLGEGGYTLERLDATWSEQLAVWLSAIVPVMLGLGLLALFIEFKTPGFGIFGVVGLTLLGLVFLSNFVAGLSGHEPALIFALGLILVAVELFFLPGTVVFALSGVVLMLGSLLWSMADIWPNEPISISGDIFLSPLLNLLGGLALALLGGLALLRFLPKGVFWDRVVLAAAATGTSAPEIEEESLIGQIGVAATALFPSGQIEVDGRRYEARVAVGTVDVGQPVVVRARREFELLVEKVVAAHGTTPVAAVATPEGGASA